MIIAVTDLEEIPEICGDCPLMVCERATDYGECSVTGESIYGEEMKERLYSCPLKEVDGI